MAFEIRASLLLNAVFAWALAGAVPSYAQQQDSPPVKPLLTKPASGKTPPAAAAKPTTNATARAGRSAPDIAELPAGLPLRVQVDRRFRMRKGETVQGHLIDPVYSVDHIVLPVDTAIEGKISDLTALRGSTRVWARLNGDFTPLKQPVIVFDSLQLPDGLRLPIQAEASERTADLVKMGAPKKKKSLFKKAVTAMHTKFDEARQSVSNAFHSHHKSDRALQILYGQLPYHPQDIWPGTEFDADLTQPLAVPDPHANKLLPVTPPHGHIPPGTLDARLLTPLSSKTDKVGNPVQAVLTEPYLAKDGEHVILPVGTQLVGKVTQAKPARKFGRNGTLRFTFREIELHPGDTEQVHAQMTAVEGQKGQNVTLDSEGGAQANADKGKYVDPLLLGYLAGSNAVDTNQNQVDAADTSNGFGLVARVASILFINAAAIGGFAYYALGQSVTRRWLMPGHQVVFAKNTRMQLSVADR